VAAATVVAGAVLVAACAGSAGGQHRASSTSTTADPNHLVPGPATLPAGMSLAGLYTVVPDAHHDRNWDRYYRTKEKSGADDVDVVGIESQATWPPDRGAPAVRVHGLPAQVVVVGPQTAVLWREHGFDVAVGSDHPDEAGPAGLHLVAVAAQVQVDPSSGPRLSPSSGMTLSNELAGVETPGLPGNLALESGDHSVFATDDRAVLDRGYLDASTRYMTVSDWDHPWSQLVERASRGHGTIEALAGDQGQRYIQTLLPTGYAAVVHIGARTALVTAVHMDLDEVRAVTNAIAWSPERRVQSSVDDAVAQAREVGVDDAGLAAPVFGISGGPAESSDGLVVSHVQTGSPAATAGILEGDVILSIDGRPVRHLSDVLTATRSHSPGDRVTVRLRGIDAPSTVVVTLGPRPG
jgi:PDZ domain